MVGFSGAALTSPLLKICGLRLSEQAAAIASFGVDALGVIAVQGSPRYLPPSERAGLFAAMAAAGPLCRGVLVVANPSDQELAGLQSGQGHHVVQLHGAESVERCRQLRLQLPGIELWKALRVRSQEDLAQVERFAAVVDAVLLDAWVPGVLGGTGHRIPLEWLAGFAPPLPWWLAGGIEARTAEAALAQVHPDGLDASSALELSPGIKDLQRVQDLVAVVAAARQDQSH